MTNPIVVIGQGTLQGFMKNVNNKIYNVFKGIPYAKPPVGELRFKVPEPPVRWEGVRDATKDCNICAQFDKMSMTVVGKEDCLYLNVATPFLPSGSETETLPVMVFVHGGGFMFGNGTDSMSHGPDWLVEQDVVVVNFNYRLGILGFLCLDRPDAPGNMGLRDQVQALRWVQQNISKFGGDSKNVTVFGVSAGGASVEYLLLSPMAKGLFHKVIMQSGSTLLNWAINKDMRDIIKKIPQVKDNITNDAQLIQLLKDMPYKDLIEASMSALGALTWKGGLYFGFVPTVEKPGDWEPFLDKSPYELLSSGKFLRVPVMSGFCSREAILLRVYGPHLLEKLKQDKVFIDHLPFEIDDAQKVELEAKLKNLYLEAENRYGEDDEFAVNYFSDVDFIGGIYVSGSLISKNNNFPVYLYEFRYSGKLNYLKTKLGIKSPGACHGDETGYIQTSALLPTTNISDTDKTVRDRMVMMFTNFAKYSDPTPKVEGIITTKWKPLAQTGAGAGCLLIDDQLTMGSFAYPKRAMLFEQLFKGQYSPK